VQALYLAQRLGDVALNLARGLKQPFAGLAKRLVAFRDSRDGSGWFAGIVRRSSQE
jgi:hypothetical protein